MTETRKMGTIARLFHDRVYGFIHCPADERDYFFHQAQLENRSFSQLTEGDSVSFLVGHGPNQKIEAQEIQFLHCGVPPTAERPGEAGHARPVKQSRYRRR